MRAPHITNRVERSLCSCKSLPLAATYFVCLRILMPIVPQASAGPQLSITAHASRTPCCSAAGVSGCCPSGAAQRSPADSPTRSFRCLGRPRARNAHQRVRRMERWPALARLRRRRHAQGDDWVALGGMQALGGRSHTNQGTNPPPAYRYTSLRRLTLAELASAKRSSAAHGACAPAGRRRSAAHSTSQTWFALH